MLNNILNPPQKPQPPDLSGTDITKLFPGDPYGSSAADKKGFLPTVSGGGQEQKPQKVEQQPPPTEKPPAPTAEATPENPFKVLLDKVAEKRRKKAKSDPDYERRVDKELNRDRVNIILFGLDKRPDKNYALADAIVILSFNPKTNTVDTIRIPRDIHAPEAENLSGAKKFNVQGDRRINSVTTLGTNEEAAMVVENATGISADMCVFINFNAFKTLVDAAGGVTINVPAVIHDDKYPTEDYGVMTVHFDPGSQFMDGERALIYSRVRHNSTDYARGNRQIEVAKALAAQVYRNFRRNPKSLLDFKGQIDELYKTGDLSLLNDFGLQDYLSIIAGLIPNATSIKMPEIKSHDPWTKGLISGQRQPPGSDPDQTYIGDPKATGTPPPDPKDPLDYWNPVRNWVKSNLR